MTVVISRRAVGVRKLSELEIDSDKDWSDYSLLNVGNITCDNIDCSKVEASIHDFRPTPVVPKIKEGRVYFDINLKKFRGYDGTKWVDFGAGGGVTKLSELEIDVDKDWQGYGISNLGDVSINDYKHLRLGSAVDVITNGNYANISIHDRLRLQVDNLLEISSGGNAVFGAGSFQFITEFGNFLFKGNGANVFRIEDLNDTEWHIANSIYEDGLVKVVGTRWALPTARYDYHIGIGITKDQEGKVLSGVIGNSSMVFAGLTSSNEQRGLSVAYDVGVGSELDYIHINTKGILHRRGMTLLSVPPIPVNVDDKYVLHMIDEFGIYSDSWWGEITDETTAYVSEAEFISDSYSLEMIYKFREFSFWREDWHLFLENLISIEVSNEHSGLYLGRHYEHVAGNVFSIEFDATSTDANNVVACRFRESYTMSYMRVESLLNASIGIAKYSAGYSGVLNIFEFSICPSLIGSGRYAIRLTNTFDYLDLAEDDVRVRIGNVESNTEPDDLVEGEIRLWKDTSTTPNKYWLIWRKDGQNWKVQMT